MQIYAVNAKKASVSYEINVKRADSSAAKPCSKWQIIAEHLLLQRRGVAHPAPFGLLLYPGVMWSQRFVFKLTIDNDRVVECTKKRSAIFADLPQFLFCAL